jgi:hypothetical protein
MVTFMNLLVGCGWFLIVGSWFLPDRMHNQAASGDFHPAV